MQQLYVAYYGRSGDPGGVLFWAERLDANGGDLTAIINDFGNSAEFVDRYGGLSDLELISNLFLQMFGREPPPDEAGVQFWLGRIRSGSTLAEIATQIADGAQNEDLQTLDNRTRTAILLTQEIERQQKNFSSGDIPLIRNAIAQVTEETDPEQLEVFALVAGLAGGSRTTVSTSDAYPLQLITVLHPDIVAGETVDVVFTALIGGVESAAKGVAAADGRVEVAVPVHINASTGSIEAGAVRVSALGEDAAGAMAVQSLLDAPFDRAGVLALGMFEFARRENRALRSNLLQIQADAAGASEVAEQIAAVDATIADLDAKIVALESGGGLTVPTATGQTVLGGQELADLDSFLLMTLASLRTVASDDPQRLDPAGRERRIAASPAGDARRRRARSRLDRILENWRESFDALDNSTLDNEEARRAIGDLFRQTWEDTKTKGGEGATKFASFFAIVTAGAANFGRGALAEAGAAYNLAAEQFSVFVGSASAFLNRVNTDEFLAENRGEFDETAEAISQFTRIASNYLGNVEPGEFFSRVNTALTVSDGVEAWIGDAEQALCSSEPSLPFCSGVPLIANVTGDGFFSASSTFDPDDFRPANAGDGFSSTNWFSDGEGGGGGENSEVLTWSSSRDIELTRVEVDPETFQGGGKFGFAAAQIYVRNLAGDTVFSTEVVGLPGSRVDLRISLPANTVGSEVQLFLYNHQDPGCGGISEMRIFGLRGGD